MSKQEPNLQPLLEVGRCSLDSRGRFFQNLVKKLLVLRSYDLMRHDSEVNAEQLEDVTWRRRVQGRGADIAVET